jgi:glycerol-3-phosphate acyltransferase PlsX
LIDAGANPEAKAEHLMHNAILGANYAKVILGVANPRVGLITIGTEEGKGNSLITETHEHLKKITSVINYVGPIEGFQVFKNTVDVVVCDGFVGNTLLKTWESLAKFITTMLKEELKANPLRMGGALLAKGAFSALRARMNPDEYGGAPLLGVRGNVLKAHGSSNRHAWASAIRAAGKIIKYDLYHHIETDVASANALIQTSPPEESAN